MALLLLLVLLGSTQDYSFDDYVKLGVEQLRQGLNAEAIRSAEKALSLKPNSIQALSLGGKAYIQNGNYDRGIEMFRRILPLATWTPEDHFYVGLASYKLQRMEAAQQQFEMTISLMPTTPVAYVYLGDVYVQIGNTDAAIKILEKYLGRFPKDQNRALVEKILSKLRQ